jgi:ABC-type Mn2+/Zn2+ transport system ATPase subunit
VLGRCRQDRPSTLDLMELFGRLTAGGRTVLVATHDLALTRWAFDRCLAINAGLVADGDPKIVLDAGSLEATFGSGRAPVRMAAA